MPTPAFSVLIPCYNCERTLVRAVRSVQAQSFQDFEILLVDDGSRDMTLELARALACNDPRIRVLSQPNAGAAAARNHAAASASGTLLAFLDADDWWHTSKLARHYALHSRQGDVDASFARIAFMLDEDTPPQTESVVPSGPLRLSQILAENPVCTMSNAVVRRDSFHHFGPFLESLSHAEDQEWLARMIARGGRVIGLDACLTAYRTNAGGLSSELARMHAGWRSFAYDYGNAATVRQYEAVYCRYLARRALRLKGRGAAWLALSFTLQGLRLSATAFLADPRRGYATAGAALLAPLLPNSLRTKIFA